jgi:hypothetical protein
MWSIWYLLRSILFFFRGYEVHNSNLWRIFRDEKGLKIKRQFSSLWKNQELLLEKDLYFVLQAKGYLL